MTPPVNVLIAGGGVAGLEAALTLRELLHDRVELTLLSATPTFHFRPLAVGTPFGLGAPTEHDLATIARRLDMRIIGGTLSGVDPLTGDALLAEGARLANDRLLIAIGAPGRPASPFGVTFERGGAFDDVLADLLAGLISHVAFAIPRSTSWPLPAYELALMTAAWGRAARPDGVRVSVVSHEGSPLELFGSDASAVVAERLRAAGVEFSGGHEPVLESDTAVLHGSHRVIAERIVVMPEPCGPALAGLPSIRDFLPVDPWGRVEGIPAVYAAGDAANHPIKHGGLAAQQATAAASAIAHDAAGAPAPGPPRPVLRGLLRTIEGPLYLRAVLGDEESTSVASSEPLWWPPSKLAAPRLSSLLGRIDRERSQGIVLPTGGLRGAA